MHTLTKENGILAWHFISRSRRERFGERRLIRTGRTYKVAGKLSLCQRGLHGSKRAVDALFFAPLDGWIACRVLLWGQIIEETNKLVASCRTVLAMRDVESTIKKVHDAHTHAHTHTNAYTHAHAHTHTNAYSDALTNAYANAHAHAHPDTYANSSAGAYAYTYTHTHSHSHSHAHSNTYNYLHVHFPSHTYVDEVESALALLFAGRGTIHA